MSRTEENLQELLQRLRNGDRSALRETLRLLADRTVFAPVSFFVDVADAKGTKKAKVVTLVEEGRRLIPAFSSEELFRDWSQGEYECLPIRAGDFALTLPPDTNLLLDPGLRTEYEFSQSDLKRLDDVISERTIHREAVRDEREPTTRAPQPLPTERTWKVERALTELLRGFPEVVEGYFLETGSEQNEILLGLLTQDLSHERRFVLITEIGELSRNVYGYSGAIETYTDLHIPYTSSWELFRMEQPFYLRETESPETFVQFPEEDFSVDPPPPEGEIEQPGFSLWRMFQRRRVKF